MHIVRLDIFSCRFAAGIIAVFFLGGVGTFGLVASETGNYTVRSWHAENGLPQNSVAAICQTRDGYLWLGTYSGLVRFDGVRFVSFDVDNTPALETIRITSLFEDADGVLWIGHESGELTCYQNGKFAAVKVPAAWNGETIAKLFSFSGDKLWLASRDGTLLRLQDGLMITNVWKGEERSITQFEKDSSGRVWVLRNGLLGWLHGETIQPWLPDGLTPSYRVQAIATSRKGGVWIVYNGQIRRWEGGGWRGSADGFQWESGVGGYVTSIVELRSGALAVGTAGRGILIFQFGAKPLLFNRANQLDNDWIRSLCEDREGNLWAGVGNSGLVVLRPANFTTFSPPDRMNGYSVLSVSPCQDGGLWVGSEGAGLYRFDGTVWTNYSDADGLSNRYIWSVGQDTDGKVWAGSWGAGIFVGQKGHFQTAPGLKEIKVPMPAMLVLTNDELWLGTRIGLLHYQRGKHQWYGQRAGLVSPDVRCVAKSPDGEIWFGMMGGGLGCLKDGKIRQYRKQDGLAGDSVLCLRFETNGVLWLGTFGGGISRFKDGKFSRISAHDGLANNSISDIEDDGLGNFWFASEGGVFFASKAVLNRLADDRAGTIDCTTFDMEDGMETMSCASGFQPAGCRTADGRLWFPTLKGVVCVNPSRLRTNPIPPPVLVEGLYSDGLESSNLIQNAGDRQQPLQISPGHERFEFRYTALSFTDPEKVRFKYQLEGLEKNWVDAGQKRSAVYSYLPPGKYTFHVTACNNNGLWNETGDAQVIVILPYFWQRTSFQVAAGILAATAVGALARYFTRRRYRRKLAAVERERALERERARIAKDIHDDLGSSLTRITMLSESARREAALPEEKSNYLQTIYETSRELTRSMDEIVWAVNPRHDTLSSLATYLLRHAQEFLGPASIRLRSEIPLELPTIMIPSEVRHNVFLAYKEALHNVVKHARASAVNVSLALSENFMEIGVADDGVGFVPKTILAESISGVDRLAGGNGLENMKKRLEQIHGECRIQSTAGQGTKVIFRVPLKSKTA